jgi:hypothetical protein
MQGWRATVRLGDLGHLEVKRSWTYCEAFRSYCKCADMELIAYTAASLIFLAVILVLRWFGVIPRVEPWRPRWYERLRLWMRLRRLKRLESQPAWKRRQPRPRWAVWAMVALVSLLGIRILALRWHPAPEIAQDDQPKQPTAQPAPQPVVQPQEGSAIELLVKRTDAVDGYYVSSASLYYANGKLYGDETEFMLKCDKSRSDCAELQSGRLYTFKELPTGNPRGYVSGLNLVSVQVLKPDSPLELVFATEGLPDSIFCAIHKEQVGHLKERFFIKRTGIHKGHLSYAIVRTMLGPAADVSYAGPGPDPTDHILVCDLQRIDCRSDFLVSGKTYDFDYLPYKDPRGYKLNPGDHHCWDYSYDYNVISQDGQGVVFGVQDKPCENRR